MSKLVLMLWSVFSLSCANTSSTQKNTAVSEVRKPATEEVVPQTYEIQKTDDIQIEEEIKETPPAEKTIVKKPIGLPIEEIKTEVKDIVIETSTKKIRTKEKDAPVLLEEKNDLWNELLAKYVSSDGNVDYKGFLKDKEKLQAYLDDMAANNPQKEWSKKEKLVYYINIYNAGTVKLILDNYPTKSIKDINKPWAKEIVKIGENTFSLGDIEHKILRKMNEPRIHFAINCASYSCPKLMNEAFAVSNIEEMLERATVDFINDPQRNKITEDKLQLSNIFKWYKKDFNSKGSLINYINPYTENTIDEKANISFLKYDWSLNEAK